MKAVIPEISTQGYPTGTPGYRTQGKCIQLLGTVHFY